MTCHRQWPESIEEPSVFDGDQTEGQDDKQDCFFVYMPAEEERGIAAESQCTNKIVPCRL